MWNAVVAAQLAKSVPAASSLATSLAAGGSVRALFGKEASSERIRDAVALARDASWLSREPRARRFALVLAGHGDGGALCVRRGRGDRMGAGDLRELVADFHPDSEIAVVVDACGAGNFLRLPMRRERGVWVPDPEGRAWPRGAPRRVHCLGSAGRGRCAWTDAFLPDLARLARAPGGAGILWRGGGAHLQRTSEAGTRSRWQGAVLCGLHSG